MQNIYIHTFSLEKLVLCYCFENNSKELFDYCMGAEETDNFFLKKCYVLLELFLGSLWYKACLIMSVISSKRGNYFCGRCFRRGGRYFRIFTVAGNTQTEYFGVLRARFLYHYV